MFRGRKHLSLDSKGRMAIPARYRESLLKDCEGQFVMTVDRAPCLLLYPLPEWQEVEAKIAQLPSAQAKTRRFKRFLLGNAEDCDMDRQGRVRLPPTLREFAHLDKQIVLVGQGNKFEIWNEAHWNQENDQWLSEADNDIDLPEALASLNF